MRLNGGACGESEIRRRTSFVNLLLARAQEADVWREFSDVDGYIVVYSITDRRSFQKAADVVADIRRHRCSIGRHGKPLVNKPLLLVANKNDLERARVVAKEGLTRIRFIT